MTGAAFWDAAAVGAFDVLRPRVAAALAENPYDGDAIAADALIAAVNREIDKAVYRAAGAAGAIAGPEAQLALGAAWQYADDVAPAVARLEQGVRRLLEAGRLDRALSLLEQCADALPPRAPLFYALGLAREEAGDPIAAADAYRLAITVAPPLAAPALRLAALSEERDPRDAAAALAHALAADSRQPQIWLKLGRLLHRIGDPHGARDAFEHSLRQEPGGALVEFELGELLLRMGRRQDALERFRAAVAQDATLAEAHFELGALLEESDLDAAVDAYRRAVAARPGYTDATLRLGAALERLRRFDDALISLRLGAAESPARAPEFLRRILSVLFRKKDWAAIAEAALDGMRRAPDDADFAYDRARALVAAGAFQDAEDCLLDYARHRAEIARQQPPSRLEHVHLWSNQMADALAWRTAHPAEPEAEIPRDWAQALAAGRVSERRAQATAPQLIPGAPATGGLVLTLGAQGDAQATTLCVRHHLQQGCDAAVVLDDGTDPERRAALERLAAETAVAIVEITPQTLLQTDQATLALCVARDALGARWGLIGAPDLYWLAPEGGLRAAIDRAATGPFAAADLLLARVGLILPRQNAGIWPPHAFWSQTDVMERPWPRLDDQRDDDAPLADQTVRPHAYCVRLDAFRAAAPGGAPPLSAAPATGWFVDVGALRFAAGALAPWGASRPAAEHCVEAPLNQWLKERGRLQTHDAVLRFVEQGMRLTRRLRPFTAEHLAAAQRRGDGLRTQTPSFS